MIPYVAVSQLSVGPIALDVEMLFTIVGLGVAFFVASRRAHRLGIDSKILASFLIWLLVGSVIGGHLADTVCYRFSDVADFLDGRIYWKSPWELLRLWHGWRSFGGFFGAIVGALLWRSYLLRLRSWRSVIGFGVEAYWFVRRERRQPILALADVVLSSFPIAWGFNRAAAALVHDHPGMRAPAASLFAVAYPDSTEAVSMGFGFFHGSVPRYDLSLFDFGATLVIVAVVLAIWRRTTRIGSYVCLVGVTYAPARFVLDFLRPKTGYSPDPVLATLTPAQWGFAVLCVLSTLLLLRIWLSPENLPPSPSAIP